MNRIWTICRMMTKKIKLKKYVDELFNIGKPGHSSIKNNNPYTKQNTPTNVRIEN